MKRTSTYFAKAGDVPDEWRVIDATGISLGRLARQVAVALQGKDQPTYTPHVITGCHVVVINADKVRVTGRKLMQKMYYRHSGYVGNLKSFLMRDMMEQRPGARGVSGREGNVAVHQAGTPDAASAPGVRGRPTPPRGSGRQRGITPERHRQYPPNQRQVINGVAG